MNLAASLGLLLGLALTSAGVTHAQCEVLKLTGPDADPYFFKFGYSVSLSGDRMAAGSPRGLSPGFADVFERSATGAWVSAGTVVASDGEVYDEFGYSVAIDGNTLVVGATDDGLLGAKGAAYVFERQADGVWLETQKLVSPEANAWAFGYSVDIDGDRFVVGAKGASDLGGGQGWAFVYEREGGTWIYKAPLVPSISVPGDTFGGALDLEGERVVVGASYQYTGGGGPGMAFLFERDPSGTTWSETAALQPNDMADNDLFGHDVALHEDRIVAGAPVHNQPTLLAGAAYVYDRIDGAWVQTAKLSLADAPILSVFGWSVDVEQGVVAIGAPQHSEEISAAGVAYLFQEVGGAWIEGPSFVGSGVGVGDTFGNVLDLEGSELLVGAPNTGGDYPTPGYAFLYDLAPSGPSLIADSDGASLSGGGTQTLQLGACTEHADDLYFLAGTATGTSPGFTFAGLSVPLNPDVYFLHTVNHVGAAPLVDAFGTLDFNGWAEAGFALPPGSSPALAGLVLHHAYCVLDGATLQVEAVSEAVPVTLVP